ncbi:Actin-related protein 5 [Asimina triloba]
MAVMICDETWRMEMGSKLLIMAAMADCDGAPSDLKKTPPVSLLRPTFLPVDETVGSPENGKKACRHCCWILEMQICCRLALIGLSNADLYPLWDAGSRSCRARFEEERIAVVRPLGAARFLLPEMMKKPEKMRCPLSDLKRMGGRLSDLEWADCCLPFARLRSADRSSSAVGLVGSLLGKMEHRMRCSDGALKAGVPAMKEIARKAAIKERQGQRLREMASAKRTSRITELETELQGLEFLLQQMERVLGHEITSFLAETGCIQARNRGFLGEPLEVDEKIEPSSAEKYQLLNVPDDMQCAR